MDAASPNAKAFADTLSAYDLVQHINKPTHMSMAHTLDLLISRPADGGRGIEHWHHGRFIGSLSYHV